jgi:phosphoenolpyruvate carboxylase
MPRPQPIEPEDKNRPLRKDIRLLGRILGDKVPEQSGDVVSDTVERIRQTSVRFRRDEDVAAQREFEATLNGLPPSRGRRFRSFAPSFFLHSAILSRISITFAAPAPTHGWRQRRRRSTI